MKKLIIAIVATLLIATPSFADNTKEQVLGFCSTLSGLAELMMQARQAGASMEDNLKVAQALPLAEAILIEAYNSPRFHTEEAQNRAVQDFKNSIFVQCYTTFNK